MWKFTSNPTAWLNGDSKIKNCLICKKLISFNPDDAFDEIAMLNGHCGWACESTRVISGGYQSDYQNEKLRRRSAR